MKSELVQGSNDVTRLLEMRYDDLVSIVPIQAYRRLDIERAVKDVGPNDFLSIKEVGEAADDTLRHLQLPLLISNSGFSFQNALRWAACTGNETVVTKLLSSLDEEVSIPHLINSKDVHGRTALHLAVTNSHWKIVRLLIEIGAEILNLDEESQKLLFDQDKEIVHKEFSGQTLLHQAAARGAVKSVKFLLGRGAKVDARNRAGETPLHLAVNTWTEVKEGIVRELLQNGADVKAKNDEGWTALLLAIWDTPSIKIMQMLLDGGANVNDTTPDGKTMLHVAVERRCNSTVLGFLSSKIHIDSRGNFNMTPLHLAVRKSASTTIEYLLSIGADKEAETGEGRTALELAVDNWLFGGRDGDRGESIKVLLTQGARLRENAKGETILHAMAHQSDSTPVHTILEWGGVKVMENLNEPRLADGKTPLQIAAEEGHVYVVAELLKAQADVNVRDKDGKTALDLAECNGKEEIVKLFRGEYPFLYDPKRG